MNAYAAGLAPDSVRSRQGHRTSAIVLTFAAVLLTLVPASASGGVKVSAGRYHTCAMKTSGKLACWGNDSFGQTDLPPSLG